MITFKINRKPKALQRHRQRADGKMYDPSTRDKENFLIECLNYRPVKPFDGPLDVSLTFVYKLPKKYAKLEDPPLFVTITPDIDNLIKFVFDALNGEFWNDDKIIASVRANKIYADHEGYIITIKELV